MAVFTPEDYGAVGDGVTNDTEAFQDLSIAVAAAGGGLIRFNPNTIYLVGGLANQPYSATPVAVYYNWHPTVQYILDLNGLDNVVVEGNGATIRNASGGKYGTFNSDGTPRTPATMPYTSTGAATPFRALIRVSGCGLVEIANLTLDGNLPGTDIGSGWGDHGIQLPMIGLQYVDNVGPVRTDNVIARGFGTDGFHVNELGSAVGADGTNWTMRNCVSTNNGRQGMSVVGGNGLRFEGCTFKDTGADTNGVASNPGAGVDIESEGGKKVRNLAFLRCEFLDNRAQALVADQGDTGSADCSFYDCKFRRGWDSGATNYTLWLRIPGLKFYRCKIFGTTVWQWTGGNVPFDAVQWHDCYFSNDPANSPTGVVVTNYGLLFDNGVAHVTFYRCLVEHNVNVSASNSNTDSMRFVDCTIVAKSGGIALYGRFAGKTVLIDDGGTVAAVPDALITGRSNAGHAEDGWTMRTGGVTTAYAATIDVATGCRLGTETITADTDATLTVGTDRRVRRYTGTLTANRTLTLATTGARQGSRFRIVRTGGGAFTLSVGSLKALATNQWCEIEFTRAGAWVLTAAGSL